MIRAALLAAFFAGADAVLPVPTIQIADGVNLPMAGLGTWQYNNSVAHDATLAALKLGYTHIDTAWGYYNQEGIGQAIAESGRDRESFFITSKIPGGLNTTGANAALDDCLTQLGVDYVDLMLVHYPAAWSGEGGKALRQEGWKALEAFQKAGKAKAIGVSHFCENHIQDILEINTVPIAVNQVQYHVGMGLAGPNATDDKEFDIKNGILYQSFSPLCGPCGTTELMDGPLVTEIGKRYGKSGSQVSLKWIVQQGIPVIPKTHREDYMLENVDLFDWNLSAKDMAALTAHMSPPVAGTDTKPPTSGDCDVL